MRNIINISTAGSALHRYRYLDYIWNIVHQFTKRICFVAIAGGRAHLLNPARIVSYNKVVITKEYVYHIF